jgi:hypothetical protein
LFFPAVSDKGIFLMLQRFSRSSCFQDFRVYLSELFTSRSNSEFASAFSFGVSSVNSDGFSLGGSSVFVFLCLFAGHSSHASREFTEVVLLLDLELCRM